MKEIKIEIPRKAFLPVYQHLLEPNDFDIEFLWGGRDSGKSAHIARQLIVDCLQSKYFRCILIKKTAESIKDSQWQTLKDAVHQWGMESYFEFKISPLQIVCKLNGNKFIARGCDKPEKVKSINNPSHVWYEEGNQLTQEDYITVSTTLRSNQTKVKQYFSFNPECDGDFDDFWLYKTYFKKQYEQGQYSFTETITEKLPNGEEASLRYRSTWSTYKHNRFCTNERIARLEGLKKIDPYYYQVFTCGMWGHRASQNPFIVALRDSQISEAPKYDPNKQLIVSLDFNIDPFGIIFLHEWKDPLGEHTHIFDEAEIENGSIPKAAEYIQQYYPASIPFLKLTGDAGGSKRSIEQRDNMGLYVQLARALKLRPGQVIVPKANPFHKTSRADCNYFMMHYDDLQINRSNCPNLVFDIQYVEVDQEGHILKSNRKDKTQRADYLDCFRYYVNTFKKEWVLRHQKRNK